MDDYESDSFMESSNNDSCDGESIASVFNIQSRMNNKLDAENLFDDARTSKVSVLVFGFMRNDKAWHCNGVYKAIMTTLKEE